MLYIYTSGTTGLPKPGIIKQSRYTGAGFVFFESAGLTKEDRIYVSLPIYHGNGFFIGIGSAIICGATVSKFSKYIFISK
jgi:acyl-CoA synthetase (AMP-forming)/AMP-acid ligase II